MCRFAYLHLQGAPELVTPFIIVGGKGSEKLFLYELIIVMMNVGLKIICCHTSDSKHRLNINQLVITVSVENIENILNYPEKTFFLYNENIAGYLFSYKNKLNRRSVKLTVGAFC